MSLLKQVKKIHFVGIGGVGMSGIAEVLKQSGYQVSGSDLAESPTTKHLQAAGIDIYIGHQGGNIRNAELVVQSTAIANDNAEIVAAKAQDLPVIARAEMLAELMSAKHGIAISGTHGKTTTTSLISCMLSEAGFDPSFVIGGKLNRMGVNAKLGNSPYFVAEADESDASFLYLRPKMAVVTNIDEDHMTTYNGDFKQLQQTFLDFLQQLPVDGLATLCIDDEDVAALADKLERPVVTYGFSANADVRAINWQQKGLSSYFTVIRKGCDNLAVCFNLPGKHNVQNALAAIAIATELGVDDASILASLGQFQGVGRRFQMLGEISFGKGNALLIDDYGHHPKEITSTIEAIRHVWPEKRLVHVFQPHRYSRTQALFDEFSQSLQKSDEVILLDVFAAGEQPLDGANSFNLADHIHDHNKDKSVQVTSLEGIEGALSSLVQDGDIVLMQGAGSIGRAAKSISESFTIGTLKS